MFVHLKNQRSEKIKTRKLNENEANEERQKMDERKNKSKLFYPVEKGIKSFEDCTVFLLGLEKFVAFASIFLDILRYHSQRDDFFLSNAIGLEMRLFFQRY